MTRRCPVTGRRLPEPDPGTQALADSLPEGWTLYDPADPFAGLRCPHGHAIEVDGSCPEGCESPLRAWGLV